jgi:hypothetical protein
MLAVLTEAPTNVEGWDRFAFHNRTSHQAINTALSAQGLALVDPVLFPIDEGDWRGWLLRHALLHQQMDEAVGQQSADLSILDPNNPNEVSLWISTHWLEHTTAETILGVSS